MQPTETVNIRPDRFDQRQSPGGFRGFPGGVGPFGLLCDI